MCDYMTHKSDSERFSGRGEGVGVCDSSSTLAILFESVGDCSVMVIRQAYFSSPRLNLL